MIESGIDRDPIQKAELAEKPRDGELSAVDGTGLGGAQFDLEFTRLEGLVNRHPHPLYRIPVDDAKSP